MGKSKLGPILLLFPLPPPIHGASLLAESIIKSRKINEEITMSTLDISLSNKLDKIGRASISKIYTLISLYFRFLFRIAVLRPKAIMIMISPFGWGFYKDAGMILIAKLFRIKTIIHMAGKGMKDEIEKRNLFRWIAKKIFKKSDVIFLSPLLQNDMGKIPVSGKVFYLLNSIIVPSGLEKRNVGDHFRITYISNMIREKGIFIILEAAKILSETKQDLKFKIQFAGDWFVLSDKKDFENFINSNNLQNSVEYLGPCYNDEKWKLLRSTDVFVFPTFYRNETFSLVVLEALSQGIPVISTKEGAIPDMITDGMEGYLIETDPKELAEKIDILFENSGLRKDMGINGKKKFDRNFSYPIFEDKFIKIITDSLAS